MAMLVMVEKGVLMRRPETSGSRLVTRGLTCRNRTRLAGALAPCPRRPHDSHMNTQVVVAVIAAGVSVVSALVTGRMTSWSAIRTKRFEKAQSKAEQSEMILSRYR